MPTGLGAFFNTNGSVAALLLALFNLAVSTLVYLPFVVISNKARASLSRKRAKKISLTH
ncbi:PTS system chitobiose-specific transporter subunit IIC [Klebsiella michiganensis]|nr:PTS system chitobiose-specific transporter subunit IIC [Klebsiella michiganensis]